VAAAFLAAIDGGTASIIGAILVFASAMAGQIWRKTKPEAAVDKSTARLNEAQAWGEMLEQQKALSDQHLAEARMWQAEVETLRQELAEERDERDRERQVRDRKISELEATVRSQGEQIERLQLLLDRA
jgi:hypothetical protein